MEEPERQPGLIEVGRLDQITPGHGRCVIAGRRQIAVFRMRDGRLFALDDQCPHRAGPLSEGVVGLDHASQLEAVVCPFHSYKFALRDGRGLDTELHVRSYPVVIRDSRKRAGHWPTLVCSFLYFDSSFMVWTLMGALAVFIAQEFHLTRRRKVCWLRSRCSAARFCAWSSASRPIVLVRARPAWRV
jgi:nitrite reductase (NADH) small subunit